MDNNIDINLYLPDGEGVSFLKKKIFQEELDRINKQFPLQENQININKTYMVDRENALEVGFFIRSTVKKDICIGEADLGIENINKEIVISQKFNFKELGVIPSYCGIPVAVHFNKHGNDKFYNVEGYSLKFVNLDSLQSFLSVNSEIENLSANLSFEEEKEILDYVHKLEVLKKNEISLSVFKLTKNESGGIAIEVLVRNGYENEAKLEKIPISIFNENNVIIARSVFENPDGIVKVSPYKSKLVKFVFESSNIYISDYELSKCKVLYK
jgi:SLAP domain-containing protein